MKQFLLQDYSTARLKSLGRWKNIESMELYLQEAMAALVMNQLDSRIMETIERINKKTKAEHYERSETES